MCEYCLSHFILICILNYVFLCFSIGKLFVILEKFKQQHKTEIIICTAN